MSKLTLQATIAARDAAAAANTRANEALEALRELSDRIIVLYNGELSHMLGALRSITAGTITVVYSVNAAFRDQLEATANSYGFTLADHPTRKDLVVIEPMED